MLKNIIEAGRFEGFKVSTNGPAIPHLHNADDTLIFCEASMDEICNVATFLQCCEPALGMKVNFHRTSLVLVGCGEGHVSSFEARVGCKVERFPIKYLGIPILDSWLSRNVWDSTIKIYQVKLD
ncbi:hypothetical protein AMTRI_Chr10g230240 [Amborella trichopoda]